MPLKLLNKIIFLNEKLVKNKKKLTSNWFKFLQIETVNQFQAIENNYCKENGLKIKKFIRRNWKKEKSTEGGGTSYILTNGSIFEKVGVNFSIVSGIFEKSFRSKILGAQKNGRYWASGISVVAHMRNPKIPALHFNTRFISTSKEWFGGGMDATPSYKDKKEIIQIHKKLKNICLTNKKKIIINIKSGVINIFIFLIEKNREELVVSFLIMKQEIGKKILSL